MTPEVEVTSRNDGNRTLRTLVSWMAFLAIVIAGGWFFYGIFSVGSAGRGHFTSIVLRHFPAVVGLPVSALASLGLVLFLEHQAGPIELEALGFKFRGASGPAIIWCMCFIVMVIAIKELWVL